MKRITSVLIAVLLGACTTAVGVVPFLVLANQDRDQLSLELEQANERAERAETEKSRIAEEANVKVQEANREIQRAQVILESFEEDQRLMAEAKRLAKPPSHELYRWQPIVSLYQEVKLAIPPKSEIISDTKEALAIRTERASDATFVKDDRWLAITPYHANDEQELLGALTTSTEISYIVQGHLLTGKKGVLENGQQTIVLKTRYAATSTHLIWMKDPGTLGRKEGFERLLGTLEFNS